MARHTALPVVIEAAINGETRPDRNPNVPRKPEEIRFIAERLPAPLMTFAPADGFATFPLSRAEMAGMGYRLAASSGTAFAAMVKAVRQSYECLAQDRLDPFLGEGGAEREMKAAHRSTGLERMLEIERRTMKGA